MMLTICAHLVSVDTIYRPQGAALMCALRDGWGSRSQGEVSAGSARRLVHRVPLL